MGRTTLGSIPGAAYLSNGIVIGMKQDAWVDALKFPALMADGAGGGRGNPIVCGPYKSSHKHRKKNRPTLSSSSQGKLIWGLILYI